MNYTIARNEQHNGLEITFDGKPSVEVRDALKALHFRWHSVRKLWYGRATVEEIHAAINGTPAPTVKAPAVNAEPQDHIKVYWNGIKVDGKLIRCFYSVDNDARFTGECVSISARDYDSLPRDLLPVTNDTDIYTDYFDSDRATIAPDHPLYRYFRYVALKARNRNDAKHVENLRKRLNGREPWPGYFDTLRTDLAAAEKRMKDFSSAKDPGQPTAADLAAIESRRIEAENARRAAEHEAELKEREHVLNMKNDGRRLIETAAAEHPIDDAAPVVTVRWSEHPAFYHWEDDALKLSIPAANRVFQALDLKAHNDPDHGYYKTAFRITGSGPDGQEIDYEGRYDIGDGEGTLIQHIRNFAEYYRTHNDYGHPIDNPDDETDNTRFVDFLESFSA